MRIASSRTAAFSTAPGLTYMLGTTLYVALTNRSPSVTLIASRGPSFRMPAASGFAPLPDGFEPTAAEAADAVALALARADARDGEAADGGSATIDGVVFGGVGDPLLRLPTLLDTARRIAPLLARPPRPSVRGATVEPCADAIVLPRLLRVTTSGLVVASTDGGDDAEDEDGEGGAARSVARRLARAGVGAVSVSLASADAAQFEALARPAAEEGRDGGGVSGAADGSGDGLADVCAFVRAATGVGLGVTCTTVLRPDVDAAAAEALAKSLGADFKGRSFHP